MKKSSLTLFAIQFEILFGFFTLLFFLLFSSSATGQGYPIWYSRGTTILELFAFFLAMILCLRNAFSSMIVSSRKVWLGIGLGMLCYFVGNIFFAYWELGLKREPDVSPGDLFYILSYLFLMVSMGLAVFERRLNLEGWQYGVIGAVGAMGVVVAIVLSAGDQPAAPAAQLNPFHTPKAIAAPVPVKTPLLPVQVAPSFAPLVAQAAAPVTTGVPGWVVAIEGFLDPFKGLLGFLYLIADTVLLIIATTLFLAFWGGRFAQSWRMIAAATFCLYIADAWFKFATTRLPNYQSGGLLEVGWVLSAILFGLGAALEYRASHQRRASSRRRA
ncbi:hypothetical protein [Romeriopsis navalis]|uniref:hypothetical protein n=1 Tax=Romeriopsis navalis TaxID=2992132 RepID=UPI0021F8BEDF|nr:hypothetical protein [Romeriopsis navalis]